MPVVTADTDFSKNAPTHRVYIKDFWAEEWGEVPYLYCVQATRCLNPSMPNAVFDWRYGVGIQAPGNIPQMVWSPETYLNKYVRLEIDREDSSISVWTGFIWDLLDARQGARLINAARVLSGNQQFVAYGLESFLERAFLRSSWVQDHYASPWDEYEVQRAIPFNEELPQALPAVGRHNMRNRSTIRGDKNAFIFKDDPKDADKWSTEDIVDYLLSYHSPKDQDQDVILQWVLASDNVLPTWDRPEKDFHGRSIKSILDELIDRRRALGWWVELEDEARDAESPRLIVRVCSFTDVLISMPSSGAALQPNQNIITSADFDLALDVTQAPLKESAAHQVDQVVVVGSPIRSCFTLGWLDNTIKKGWTDEQETAYEQGGNPNTGNISGDAKLLEQVRKHSEDLKAVYSHFILPQNWNGLVGDGIGGSTNLFLPVEINVSLGENDGPEQFYRPDLRFLDYLPFKVVRDGTEIAGTVVSGIEYAKPLCLILVEHGDTTPEDKYQHIERLSGTEDLEGEEEGAGYKWCGAVQVLDKDAGVAINIHGAPQYIFAASRFTPYENSGGKTVDRLPELDFADNLILTVFMPTDRHVTQEWPPNYSILLTDVVKRVYIDLGDKAHLDYVAPQTVVGVTRDEDDIGHLIHDEGDYYIRDDRGKMLDLARLAFEWYSTERVALKITFRLTSDPIPLGAFIQNIGAGATLKAVNSVVTGIVWDLQSGRCEIESGFAELDVAQLF